MLSYHNFLYPIRDLLDFYHILKFLGIDDVLFYKVAEHSNFSAKNYSKCIRKKQSIILLGNRNIERRFFLFSILKETLSVGDVRVLYFTKLPIPYSTEINFKDYDYIVIESADKLDWDLYQELLRKIAENQIKLILTIENENPLSQKFPSNLIKGDYERVIVPEMKYEDLKDILLSKYYFSSDEFKALYAMINGDIDLGARILNMISRNLIDRSLILSRSLKLIVNSAIFNVFKSAGSGVDFYDAILLAKKSYLNALPLEVLNALTSNMKELERILYDVYFDAYALFNTIMLNLINLPKSMLETKYFENLVAKITKIIERLRKSEPIEGFLSFNSFLEKTKEVVKRKHLLSRLKKIEMILLDSDSARKSLGRIARADVIGKRLVGVYDAHRLSYIFDNKIIERKNRAFRMIDELLDRYPLLIVSQFQAVYIERPVIFLVKAMEMFTGNYFTRTHNQIFYVFYDMLEYLEQLFTKGKHIVYVVKMLELLKQIEVNEKYTLNDLRMLFAAKTLMEEIGVGSVEELTRRASSTIAELINGVFAMEDHLNRIEAKAWELQGELGSPYLLNKLYGVILLRRKMRKVLEKILKELRKDDEVYDAFVKLLGRENVRNFTRSANILISSKVA